MRRFAIALLFPLLAGAVPARGEDPLSNGPHKFRPPGPGDCTALVPIPVTKDWLLTVRDAGEARGPCPAMNSLANHGYINRSGRKITPVAAIAGCFRGMGASPEVCGISAVNSLKAAPGFFSLSFDLEDLKKHKVPIEHDVSFSREDLAVGDSNAFNATIWQSVLDEIGDLTVVTPADLGRAKDRRVREQRERNPRLEYDSMAAKFGGTEVGMLLSTFGPSDPKLSWIRSLFEDERLPTHLGWKPTPGSNNFISLLVIGMKSLKAQTTLPEELQRKLHKSDPKPSSIFLPNHKSRNRFMFDLGDLIHKAGFDSSSVDRLRRKMNRGLV